MVQRVADHEFTWKKRNVKFLMIFGPLMVLAFTIIGAFDQYQINLKAIQEARSVGFQFTFVVPIILGLSFWIVAVLGRCQILEKRVAALEETLQQPAAPRS